MGRRGNLIAVDLEEADNDNLHDQSTIGGLPDEAVNDASLRSHHEYGMYVIAAVVARVFGVHCLPMVQRVIADGT